MSIPAPVAARKKLMTVAEFWDFVHRPENEDRDFELIRGEVVEISRPTKPHGVVCSRIVHHLSLYEERHGGYGTCNNAGIILSEDPATVVGPDVAYFTDVARFDDMGPKWAEVPPLLVVEVRSPNDRPNALIAKIGDYLNNGVKIAWLVDYEERSVAVFRPQHTPVVFTEAQELTGGDEMPGFSCRVADFVRLPGEKPSPSPTTTPN